MKKLTILLFSIFISFNSFGEWTKVTEGGIGYTFYIDTDTIKDHGGYIYWWGLIDFPAPITVEPGGDGTMSQKIYVQGDCGVNRHKHLSFVFYELPMGRGSGETINPPDDWRYPTSDSVGEVMLKYVCDYVY